MTEGQEAAGRTIGEEIQCLLAAGWTWEGDTLMHPRRKNVWIMYKRVESRGLDARAEQFDAEMKEAVRTVRRQGRERPEKLRAAKSVIEEMLAASGMRKKATNG
jgi:hypothetical protein